MNGFNKVIVMGTVGKDAEVKALENGNAVANVSIAVNESYLDKNTGEKREKTEWIRIEAWKSLANFLGAHGKKGATFLIEGKLKTDTYDKDGVTQYSTKVLAENITFAGNKPAASSPTQQPSQQQVQQTYQQPSQQQVQQTYQQPAQQQQVQQTYQQPAQNQPAIQEAAQQVNQFVTNEQFTNGMSNGIPDDMPF